jgi:hypothetical protein
MDTYLASQETVMTYEQTGSDAWPYFSKKVIRRPNINSKIYAKQGEKAVKLIPIVAGISSEV